MNVEDFKFVPPDVSVKAGGTITFTNRDKAPHTAENANFDTGMLNRAPLARR